MDPHNSCIKKDWDLYLDLDLFWSGHVWQSGKGLATPSAFCGAVFLHLCIIIDVHIHWACPPAGHQPCKDKVNHPLPVCTDLILSEVFLPFAENLEARTNYFQLHRTNFRAPETFSSGLLTHLTLLDIYLFAPKCAAQILKSIRSCRWSLKAKNTFTSWEKKVFVVALPCSPAGAREEARFCDSVGDNTSLGRGRTSGSVFLILKIACFAFGVCLFGLITLNTKILKMSSPEVESFEVTEEDLTNEFNPNRRTFRQSKNQAIYGEF